MGWIRWWWWRVRTWAAATFTQHDNAPHRHRRYTDRYSDRYG